MEKKIPQFLKELEGGLSIMLKKFPGKIFEEVTNTWKYIVKVPQTTLILTLYWHLYFVCPPTVSLHPATLSCHSSLPLWTTHCELFYRKYRSVNSFQLIRSVPSTQTLLHPYFDNWNYSISFHSLYALQKQLSDPLLTKSWAVCVPTAKNNVPLIFHNTFLLHNHTCLKYCVVRDSFLCTISEST